MLVLLLLSLLSTVSASVTQEISCQVNKEVKIDSISITRPSLADISFIFITFSALGYYFPVIDANLDQHCFPLGYAFPGHEPNFCLKCDMPTYVHNSNFENNSIAHNTNQQSPDHSYFRTEEVNCPSWYPLLVQRMKELAQSLSR